MKNQGFVTVATGDTHYYKVAVNLLESYHLFTKSPLPFAIIADRENEYTKKFDKVIILDNPSFSYMDKVALLNNIPFDETVFVEADCLAYGDLNYYFDRFSEAQDFSMFGQNYPIDSNKGWFCIDKIQTHYKDQISFIPAFHSGVMFLRKGDVCKSAYTLCNEIWKQPELYGIQPIDDEIFALAMAISNCKCTKSTGEEFLVYPYVLREHLKPKIKMHKRTCKYTKDDKYISAYICHWGNALTKKPLYKREAASLRFLAKKKTIAMPLIIAVYGVYGLLYKFFANTYLGAKKLVLCIYSHCSFAQSILHFLRRKFNR